MIDLNSPPPDHIPKVDLSLDANSNNNSAVVVRDVFDIRKFLLLIQSYNFIYLYHVGFVCGEIERKPSQHRFNI